MRLRRARHERGLTQQQLAGMTGMARQTLSTIESGLSDPSLRNALALARALDVTVDKLFEPVSSAPSVAVRPVAPLGSQGARVALALMGDDFVALPLRGDAVSQAGFLPASGLVGGDGKADGARLVEPIGPLRPTLVAAGCDPALPLLQHPLGLLDPPVAFSWYPCPRTHLRGPDDHYNTGPAAELLPQGGEVIGFCAWREGLVLRPDLAGSVGGAGDVAQRGLRLVNREPGAEARSVLDRELATLGIEAGQLPGYDTRATGHLQIASAIAAGLADAGVASEPAAVAYGLAFIPLADERFDLVIPADQIDSPAVQGLLRVLSSRWLHDQLASLPGYDPVRCGEHIATLPPARRGTRRAR
jgi:molybdate-binding protein/transcriptional regulator with XRE-family HTH domain